MRHLFRLNVFQVLALGLALLILSGAVLLTIPIANKGGSISFLDAVFTATSASCVTGLVLFDTYRQFSLFGQAVILLLIQIGGLGIMMIASLVSILLGRHIGLYQRSLLMESVGSLKIGGVVRLTKRALIGTALFEGTGMLILSFWFCPRFGVGLGLWMALFHSVSAFCNAGFDLMGICRPGSSFMTAAGVPVVNLTLMCLIVVGGLGFFLWNDLLSNHFHLRRCRLHTKIVLSGTVILLVGGTLGFYFLERHCAFAGAPEPRKWLMSAFQAVTCRTAGFNTVAVDKLSSGGTLRTILLMFVGAGSGSTGGGIKVNTFAVLVLCILSYTLRSNSTNVFRRRLDGETARKAFFATGLYLTGVVIGTMVLCTQGADLVDASFEAFSAIGTVGLSRGITATLPAVSKVAVILLMFAGRLGSLSVAMAVGGTRRHLHTQNISEKVLIG